jgi:hypothetical protein
VQLAFISDMEPVLSPPLPGLGSHARDVGDVGPAERQGVMKQRFSPIQRAIGSSATNAISLMPGGQEANLFQCTGII